MYISYLVTGIFDPVYPVHLFIIQEKDIRHQTYFFHYINRDHHGRSISIFGIGILIVLPRVNFLETDSPVSDSDGVYGSKTGILDKHRLVKIPDLRTYNTKGRILLKLAHQWFQKTRINLRIIVDQQMEAAFCNPDTQVISSGKSQIFITL